MSTAQRLADQLAATEAITELGRGLADARRAERAASARLRDAIIEAVDSGVLTEAAAARAGGITRHTVRAWRKTQK